MSTNSLPVRLGATDDGLHAGFLRILPRIERHAAIYFRDVQCTAKRQDLIAETVALCWSWYLRLMKKGKDGSKFVSALARYAARAVGCGRKLTGQEKAKDVLSSVAQKRHGFKVESLPASTRTSLEKIYSEVHGQQNRDAWEERLRDNTLTPVPDQASFRLAYPQWVRSLGRCDRRLARFLSLGNSAKDAAREFKLTPGRITQLRQQWCRDWHALHDEDVPFPHRKTGTPQPVA
jgi:hypothetical protein